MQVFYRNRTQKELFRAWVNASCCCRTYLLFEDLLFMLLFSCPHMPGREDWLFFSLKSPETTRVSCLVPSQFQPSIYAWVLQKDLQHNNGFRKKWIYGWLHTTKVDNVIRTVVLVKNSNVRRQHNHIFPLPMASYLLPVCTLQSVFDKVIHASTSSSFVEEPCFPDIALVLNGGSECIFFANLVF